MAFRLLNDRIAVIPHGVEETSASGLILGESAQGPLRYGIIAHVGNGHVSEHTGERIPLDFVPGDEVFFVRFGGQPLTVDGTEYIFLNPNEIIGVVERA